MREICTLGATLAGAGNGFTVRLMRHSQRKRGETDRLDLRNTAPVLDPTPFSSAKFEPSNVAILERGPNVIQKANISQIR